MKRALVLAAAGLCAAAAAHAQNVSEKYGWDDGAKQTCREPYAPVVPKPEETSLKELVEEVKPEIQAYLDKSNKYLECLAVQVAKAKEVKDKERLKKLIKAHNENVDYQKSVAGEFNAALNALKEESGLAVSEPKETGQDSEPAGEENPEGSEPSANTNEDETAASENGGETAETETAEKNDSPES